MNLNTPLFGGMCVTHGAAQRLSTNLDVDRQRLWQREPNEKQVSGAEGQGEQSRRLVEDTFSHSGAEGKVGAQQRPHGEAQGEGNADHGLETNDRTTVQNAPQYKPHPQKCAMILDIYVYTTSRNKLQTPLVVLLRFNMILLNIITR